MLSTRPDIVPLELIEELEKLQDEVPTFPTEDAKRLIEKELGGSIDSLFKEFPDSPFAAASMAQVYKAVLPEGEEVAIKVQRPGIADVIEIDLVIMQDYAKRLKKKQKAEMGIDPETLVSEFARAIRKELDFKIESGNVAHFDSDYQDDLKGPRDFYLLGKALSSIQGVCAEVDPDLNLMAHAKPYAEQLAMERLDPKRAIKEISSSAIETSKLMLELPYTLNDLLTQVKRGEGKVKFEIFGLEPLIDSLERIADRLSFALIMAAFLVASGLISLSTIPYSLWGIALATVFFFIAVGIGLWLLISIVRRGKLK